MYGFTYFCVQSETSWRTSLRCMCIASRLSPSHTPSMNLKSVFSWHGHLPLKRLQVLRFQAFKRVPFRFQLLFLLLLSFEDSLFNIGSNLTICSINDRRIK